MNCTSLVDMPIITDLGKGDHRVSTIGLSAFENCKALKTVTPKGLNQIASFAFKGCTGLNNVSMPPSLKSIGYSCFANTPHAATWAADVPVYLADAAMVAGSFSD
jgi:hypothetical protein